MQVKIAYVHFFMQSVYVILVFMNAQNLHFTAFFCLYFLIISKCYIILVMLPIIYYLSTDTLVDLYLLALLKLPVRKNGLILS